MAFHFHLDTLLRYRRSQKERELRVLRAIQSNLAALRHRLEELGRERSEGRLRIHAAMQRGIAGAELREQQAAEDLLDRSGQAIRNQLEKFERARLLQSARYQQSWRDCQTIENLRERQFHEWRLEQARQEQKRVDELTIQRFRRARSA